MTKDGLEIRARGTCRRGTATGGLSLSVRTPGLFLRRRRHGDGRGGPADARRSGGGGGGAAPAPDEACAAPAQIGEFLLLRSRRLISSRLDPVRFACSLLPSYCWLVVLRLVSRSQVHFRFQTPTSPHWTTCCIAAVPSTSLHPFIYCCNLP